MPQYQLTPVSPARGGAKMDTTEDLRGFNLLFMVTEVIGLVVVILVAVWTGNYRGGFSWSAAPHLQFNWHPLLNTIGMIYLFANSILVYRALRTMSKNSLKLIHTGIHGMVILLTVIAFFAVYNFHNAKNIPNFYSLHSWMGIITVIIYLLQWIFGFAAFLYPGFPTSVRVAIMPIHTFMGLMAFILAIATAFTGFTEKAIFDVTDYKLFGAETYVINLMGVMLILFGGLVVYLATESRYKRFPRPEDGGLLSSSSD